jgi:hypothetical protein
MDCVPLWRVLGPDASDVRSVHWVAAASSELGSMLMVAQWAVSTASGHVYMVSAGVLGQGERDSCAGKAKRHQRQTALASKATQQVHRA